MQPYYERDGLTIYHADARDVLPEIETVDLVLTDPPYGVNRGKPSKTRSHLKAGYLASEWSDTPEYVRNVCAPIVQASMQLATRSIVTPGYNNMFAYPEPDAVGCFWSPADSGMSRWGFSTFHPIFYYGSDPRAGGGLLPNGYALASVHSYDPPVGQPITQTHPTLSLIHI